MTEMTFGPKNPKGLCSVCAAEGKPDVPAWDGRATKCADHRGQRRSNSTRDKLTDDTIPDPADFRIDGPGADKDRPKDGKDDPRSPVTDKDRKIDELVGSIIHDLNPLMTQTFAMTCRPIPSESFFAVVDGKIVATELGKAAQFAPWEAKLMAKSVVELETSPIGKTVGAVAGPFVPIATLVAAAGAVGWHGYQLMTLRDGLLRQFHVATQAQQTAAAAGIVDDEVAPPTSPVGNSDRPNGWIPDPPMAEDGSQVTYMSDYRPSFDIKGA